VSERGAAAAHEAAAVCWRRLRQHCILDCDHSANPESRYSSPFLLLPTAYCLAALLVFSMHTGKLETFLLQEQGFPFSS